MKLLPKIITLSIALVFCSVSHAMEIDDFDKLPQKEQGDYLSSLVKNTITLLKTEGESNLAEKVSALFTADQKKHSSGAVEFAKNLQGMREYNDLGEGTDIGLVGPLRRVEDAFVKTLYKNGIKLPEKDARLITQDLPYVKFLWQHGLKTSQCIDYSPGTLMEIIAKQHGFIYGETTGDVQATAPT